LADFPESVNRNKNDNKAPDRKENVAVGRDAEGEIRIAKIRTAGADHKKFNQLIGGKKKDKYQSCN